jgi:hypothetical protein
MLGCGLELGAGNASSIYERMDMSRCMCHFTSRFTMALLIGFVLRVLVDFYPTTRCRKDFPPTKTRTTNPKPLGMPQVDINVVAVPVPHRQ